MSSSDSTLVTGSPFSMRGPDKGTVLGERWEVRELEEADALFLTLRALDQESDSVVLMRLVAPGLLGAKEARHMAARLKKLVGRGGPTINAFRDVDHESGTLYSVEPYPTGASLRSVLDARRQKGQSLSAAELLPVVVRLEAALAGIPEPFFHGDLRPQRIFVAPERVLLTGGFFLAAMPGDPLVDALARDIPLRRQFAPEVGDGLAGRPSDRWSVAALVWEALTGAAPQPGPRSAPPKLGALGPVLARYLEADPAQRPPTLLPLAEALAAAAGVSAPVILPEAIDIEPDEADEGSTELAHRPGAPGSETVELLRGPPTEPGVHDTQRLPALDKDGRRPGEPRPARDLEGIDPALLEAAAAARKISDSGTFQLDGGELERIDGARTTSASGAAKAGPAAPAGAPGDLDPRLVRAALGVALDATPARGSAPPGKRVQAAKARPGGKASGVTQELDVDDLEALGGKKPARAARVAAAEAASPARAAAPARARASSPAPVRASSPGPARTAPPGPARASSPGAAPRPPAPVSSAPPVTAPAAAAAAQPAAPTPSSPAASSPFAPPAPGTYPAPAPARRTASGTPSGTMIVGAALVLALLILGAALAYRHAQDAAERESRIEDRLRELDRHE